MAECPEPYTVVYTEAYPVDGRPRGERRDAAVRSQITTVVRCVEPLPFYWN